MRLKTLFQKMVLIAYGIVLNIGGPSESLPVVLAAATPLFLCLILLITLFVQKHLTDSLLCIRFSSLRSIFLTFLLSCFLFGRWFLQRPPVQPPGLWYSLSAERPLYNRRIRARARITAGIGRDLFLSQVTFLGVERRIYGDRKNVRPFRRRDDHRRRDERSGRSWNRRRRGQGYRKNRHRKKYQSRWRPSEPVSSISKAPFTAVIRIKKIQLHRGCLLELKLSGRGVPRRLNQTSFDQFLVRRGAVTYLWISQRYHVEQKNCPSPDLRIQFGSTVRNILRDRTRLSERARAVQGAMLFGRSRLLDRKDRDKAVRLGILHLYAASGLHLGILYGCLYLPLSLMVGRRHPLALLFPLPLCAAYLWLLEFPVSLIRAFLFLSLFTLANLTNRKMTAGNLLSNTALILLFLNPAEFCSLSGILSLGAVGGIIYFYRTLREVVFPRYDGLRGIFFSQLSLNVSASLLTTPVLLYYFKAHSFGASVANQLLVPLTGLLLPPTYLGLLLEQMAALNIILPGNPTQSLIWPLVGRGFEFFLAIADTLSPHALYLHFNGILNIVSVSALVVIVALGLQIGKRSDREDELTWFSIAGRWIIISGILLLGPPGALVIRLYELLLSLLQSGPH